MAAHHVTNCQFVNSTGIPFKLDSHMFWHGSGDPPRTIGPSASFPHTGDSDGSVGGLSYLLGDTQIAKWIVAWSNAAGTNNQVYTEILDGKETVVWDKIQHELITKGKSTYTATGQGYKSEVKIDQGTNTPNMVASFSREAAAA